VLIRHSWRVDLKVELIVLLQQRILRAVDAARRRRLIAKLGAAHSAECMRVAGSLVLGVFCGMAGAAGLVAHVIGDVALVRSRGWGRGRPGPQQHERRRERRGGGKRDQKEEQALRPLGKRLAEHVGRYAPKRSYGTWLCPALKDRAVGGKPAKAGYQRWVSPCALDRIQPTLRSPGYGACRPQSTPLGVAASRRLPLKPRLRGTLSGREIMAKLPLPVEEIIKE